MIDLAQEHFIHFKSTYWNNKSNLVRLRPTNPLGHLSTSEDLFKTMQINTIRPALPKSYLTKANIIFTIFLERLTN